MRVFLAGGSGAIGRRLTPQLVARGYQVTATTTSQDKLDGLRALYGDGGGKGPSWLKPIAGPDRVARLLIGSARQFVSAGVEIRRRQVNGQPGAIVVDDGGRLVSVFALDIAQGVVQTVRSVINPEKLGHLGPLADVRGLIRQSRR
ncbi:MAG: hypothetical protein ACJ750_13890 [Gaiellaceae bacterium]